MASPALKPKPEIPQLIDEYRKAHKAYVLASALLASWELIGITLDTKGRWGIELKSPNAVPLILFTPVFYSGYKITIEWLQCDRERRRNWPARVDFIVAHLIALSAIGIAVFQYLARIQIVDWLNRHPPPPPPMEGKQPPTPHQFAWFGLALFITWGLFLIRTSKADSRKRRLALMCFPIASVIALYLGFTPKEQGGWGTTIAMIVTGVLGGTFYGVLGLPYEMIEERVKKLVQMIFTKKAPAEAGAQKHKSG